MNLRKAARLWALSAAGVLASAPMPAFAQFFWKPADLSGPVVEGNEADLGYALPGATPAEYRAALLWNLRAGLNVAALQCQFEPTLLTLSNYNSLLAHHKEELASSFKTLGDYFKRVQGKRGQMALDQYGTRIYLGFSTVRAQLNFCQTAASVGRDAIFAPRGMLYDVARKRMRELRNSLVPHGEQAFGNPTYNYRANLPSLDEKCWKKSKLRPDCQKEWDSRLKLAAQTSAASQPIR
ncbi:hypothetical protein [Rhizorhapis suberifaciens]|uniref:Uncharacterized protein n=1 Tax=Rhizorhapis suberifaciens TaxID=13656 RepID=A0A840HRN0_9SPHN|nr:hypothetical protein [Rhizorhapis suberifaciens]MBB4640248.1 hypothetical protein [Rhizorhapis suberifaciens]